MSVEKLLKFVVSLINYNPYNIFGSKIHLYFREDVAHNIINLKVDFNVHKDDDDVVDAEDYNCFLIMLLKSIFGVLGFMTILILYRE